MSEYNPNEWLKIQVETAVQMSDKPPKIAVWGVVLELPGDVLETLKSKQVVYHYAGYWWYDYEQDKKTVCVPIKVAA